MMMAKNYTRRTWLAGGVAASATAGVIGNSAYAGMLSLLDGLKVFTRFFPNEPPRFDKRFPENVPAARVLFPDDRSVKLVGGRAHYQYPNSMHPDDNWACDTIVQFAEGLAKEVRFEPKQPEASPLDS